MITSPYKTYRVTIGKKISVSEPVEGSGVAVGGIGVAVGGTGVAVGGTGVAVGGTGVGVAGISSNSNAPMSGAEPCGRAIPRWSVVISASAVPASIATLPASKAIVSVEPPLFCNGPRLIWAEVAVVASPQLLSVSKLLLPALSVPDSISQSVAPPLLATMLLLMLSVPPLT